MIELTILGYITYFIILFYVVWMTPTLLLEYLPINLIPFKTIFQYFVEVSTGTLAFSTAFINIAGNILLTVPIGFLIYIIYRRVSFNKLLLIALMFPLVIETGQLVLHLVDISTRTIDIDDLILNALGIVIGYYLLYLIQLFIKVKNT
nr:VanZ family protein [Virgibacillus dokdonensis]